MPTGVPGHRQWHRPTVAWPNCHATRNLDIRGFHEAMGHPQSRLPCGYERDRPGTDKVPQQRVSECCLHESGRRHRLDRGANDLQSVTTK
jgi:hypothetical protein